MKQLKAHLLRFNSIYIKIFAPTIVLFAAFAVVVLLVVQYYAREVFIVHTKNSVVSFVNYYAQSFFKPEDFVLSDASGAKFKEFIAAIPKNNLVRIKIWDTNGQIIYSDDNEIIGKKFSNNKEYQAAVEGDIQVSFTKLTKADQVNEKQFKELAEIFVPVSFAWDKAPVGVVDTYWKLDSVNAILSDFNIRMALLFIAGFLLFYGINLFILYKVIIRRLHRLIMSIRRIMGGEYSVRMYDGSDEIGEVVAGVNALAKSLDTSIHILEELSEATSEEAKGKVKDWAAERPGAPDRKS